MVLSVRPEFCRRLSLDFASRRTPFDLGYILPTAGQIRNFHLLERALTGCTSRRTAENIALSAVL